MDDIAHEAEGALREADPLCVDANGIIIECRSLQEKSVSLWARTLFLHDALQAQLQNMGNLYVLLKHSIEKAQQETESRLKALSKSREEFKRLLAELAQVTIDPALAAGDSPQTLRSFIHLDDIQALESQVDILIEELRGGQSALKQGPDKLQRELSGLRERQPQIPVEVAQAPTELARLAQESAPVAHEMAEILNSLTQHYDLVTVLPDLSGTEYEEAARVVEGDRKQVLAAVEEIKALYAKLHEARESSRSCLNILERSFDAAVEFYDRVDTFTTHTLRTHVQAVQDKHSETSGLFQAADNLLNELSGLSEYYRMFRKSYYSVIVELARRRQSQQQLAKVVEEANARIAAAYTKELSIRRDFVENYHKYLPQDLWPDLDAQPMNCTVQFTEERIPEVDKSALAKALKELH